VSIITAAATAESSEPLASHTDHGAARQSAANAECVLIGGGFPYDGSGEPARLLAARAGPNQSSDTQLSRPAAPRGRSPSPDAPVSLLPAELLTKVLEHTSSHHGDLERPHAAAHPRSSSSSSLCTLLNARQASSLLRGPASAAVTGVLAEDGALDERALATFPAATRVTARPPAGSAASITMRGALLRILRPSEDSEPGSDSGESSDSEVFPSNSDSDSDFDSVEGEEGGEGEADEPGQLGGGPGDTDEEEAEAEEPEGLDSSIGSSEGEQDAEGQQGSGSSDSSSSDGGESSEESSGDGDEGLALPPASEEQLASLGRYHANLVRLARQQLQPRVTALMIEKAGATRLHSFSARDSGALAEALLASPCAAGLRSLAIRQHIAASAADALLTGLRALESLELVVCREEKGRPVQPLRWGPAEGAPGGLGHLRGRLALRCSHGVGLDLAALRGATGLSSLQVVVGVLHSATALGALTGLQRLELVPCTE
jgi:hypothetical protein